MVSVRVDAQPAYFLTMNPRDWMKASLAKYKQLAAEMLTQSTQSKQALEAMPWSQRHSLLSQLAFERQECRWEEETGVKPEETHFTLIVPIHNEVNSLPSFLRTLMLTDIPSSLHLHIIFLTNACSDASGDYVDEFLSSVGSIEETQLSGHYPDAQMHTCYKKATRGNITFSHIDTPTPGKANALHIGNSLALERGHTIAMSIDANNFVEPDALRIMYSAAHKSMAGTPQTGDVVLMSGMEQIKRQASNLNDLMEKGRKMKQHLVEESGGYVLGCFMAWNTEWMNSIGGPPAIALEDYAMGVFARVQKYKVVQVKGANIWYYGVNTMKGLVDTRARYVRGMMQLLTLVDHDPATQKLIENEAYYMKRTFIARLIYLLRKSKGSPQNFPKFTATFLLWERALQKGMQAYKQNPTNQSWEKIDATF